MFQFLIPLLATAAGTGLSMHAQDQAAKRQAALAVDSQRRQNEARNQATGEVMKRVQEFDPTQRGEQQQLIEQALQGEYEKAGMSPAITAQGVEVGSGSGDSADYVKAKANNSARVAESLRGLAQLMARTGAAGRLRQNEAIRIGDTAGDIGRIQSGANNMAGIDQIGIQSVQPSAGAQLFGGLLQGYGMGQLAGGGDIKASLRDAKVNLFGAPGTNDFGLITRKTGDPYSNWLKYGRGGD